MKPSTIIAMSACGLLLGLLQMLLLLVNPWAGVAGGVVIAALAVPLLTFFKVEWGSQWAEVLIPSLSSVAATTLVFLAKRDSPLHVWLAPLVAIVASLLIGGVRNLQSKRCALCERRLRTAVAFCCPRCGLLVCDQCWIFERSRCRLCEKNEVPIFPEDARWWDKEFGPRSSHGRCGICMAPAHEVDLRSCRRCGRPQCRTCWDLFANGQCSRCGWTVSDMPESLRPYIITSKELTDNGDVRLPRR
jgi:hypothetical protein